MLRTGVDLIEIERINRAIAKHGDRFIRRVFTPAEQEICSERVESLAARFAAKEAVAKALGTGIWREGVAWTDIEVTRAMNGEPRLYLHSYAKAVAIERGLEHWSVSLSHDRTHAIAFVVAMVQRPA